MRTDLRKIKRKVIGLRKQKEARYIRFKARWGGDAASTEPTEKNAANLKLFTPRNNQRLILDSPARFKIGVCGRRWGKSLTALNWLVKEGWETRGECWWVAPVFRQAKMAWRRLIRGIPKEAIKDLSKTDLRVELASGGVIQFHSADNFENLRGEGLKALVLDEAARIPKEAWEDVLRPALSDTGGKVFMISTPKGRNWFFDLWTRGQDRQGWPEYESWSFPTSDNPKIPKEDIEQARRTLPQDVFAQEYQACFLEGHAGVFRKIDQCIGGNLSGPTPGSFHYMGIDLAKYRDFTVISILDDLGHLVYFDRFNLIDWSFQKGLIYQKAVEYGAKVLIDSTGVGDPILDDLLKMGLPVEGFKFTQESKKELIEGLIVAMENREITFPDIPVLINELKIFEYEMGRTGRVSYSAPAGYHDDAVIALALANFLRTSGPVAWEWPYATRDGGQVGAFGPGQPDSIERELELDAERQRRRNQFHFQDKKSHWEI